MVSSKFSRPVPVQQPPPICKKGVPIVGSDRPLGEQVMTVAFNVEIDKGPFVPIRFKVDGGMLNLGKRLPTFNFHWQTFPFDDIIPFSWKVDLRINTTNNTALAILQWYELGPTNFTVTGFGPVDIAANIFRWKPKVQAIPGQTAKGQILFATTNK